MVPNLPFTDYFPFQTRPSRERGHSGLTESWAGAGHWGPGARWHDEKRRLDGASKGKRERRDAWEEGVRQGRHKRPARPPHLRMSGRNRSSETREARRSSLPAPEQPRRGQGRSELFVAAAARWRSPRLSTAPASLRPASPRHLPNLCPTMARPYQPQPETTSGARENHRVPRSILERPLAAKPRFDLRRDEDPQADSQFPGIARSAPGRIVV